MDQIHLAESIEDAIARGHIIETDEGYQLTDKGREYLLEHARRTIAMNYRRQRIRDYLDGALGVAVLFFLLTAFLYFTP